MQNAYAEWRRLEVLLATIQHQGISQLAPNELIEFGRLYRQAVAELAYLRTHQSNPDRLRYLNELAGRCYPHVYTAPRHPGLSVRRFFAVDFPRTFRRHGLWVLLAFLISMLPAVIGFAITRYDRAVADQVLSRQLLMASEGVAERHATSHDWMPADTRPMESAMLMTHNIPIAIGAFAGGMTAGLITLYLLGTNGMLLGIAAAVVGAHGMKTALNFWAFVAPHGVFELTAIFISGGAGLLVAYAILNPGDLPRRVAVRDAGKEAGKLMLGVAAMLVVAGVLEAFFSPVVLPEMYKLSVAAVEAILLTSYFAFAGRRDDHNLETAQRLSPLPPL